jgi:hypothetical protein
MVFIIEHPPWCARAADRGGTNPEEGVSTPLDGLQHDPAARLEDVRI